MKAGFYAVLILSFFTIAFSTQAQLRAFPGAEGWGAASVGGRGGAVIEVTNLNDAGPGSFREACSVTGPRTIVFRTGGVISLNSEIQLFNPNIYIAGQTAPGDGIVIKNFPIAIFTHDVIIRGLRIRIGDDLPTQSPDNRDCIAIQNSSYNVIIDHCSFSWATDENLSILGDKVNSVTVQWCILSEGLYAGIHPKGFHSMGMLIAYDASKTSVHHNLFAHNGGRNPLIARRTDHEFINNLVFDWKYNADLLEQGVQLKLDFAGNYYKPHNYTSFPELPIHIDFDGATSLGTKLYMPNNFFSPNTPFMTSAGIAALGANAVIFSNNSLLSVASTITQQSSSVAYDTILAQAGALHPQRDAIDKRVLQDVKNTSGTLIDCINSTPILLASGNVINATATTITYSMLGKPIDYSAESRKIVITGGKGAGQTRYGIEATPILIDATNLIYQATIDIAWTTIPDATSTYNFFAGCNKLVNGGYPTYQPGTPPVDTDHDGMPDNWENAIGLNPSNAADRNGTNLNSVGYTNLEVYLNGFYTSNTVTGVDDNQSSEAITISIFPNPFTSSAIIHASQSLRDATLTLYNSLGQRVREIANVSGQEIGLCREGLENGFYFIRIAHGEKAIYVARLMITD